MLDLLVLSSNEEHGHHLRKDEAVSRFHSILHWYRDQEGSSHSVSDSSPRAVEELRNCWPEHAEALA